MKKIILFPAVLRLILATAIISFTIVVNAQSVAVNTTGTSADASAMLDISSSNKGMLTPRMTTTQRTAIVSPANGLLVFDTDTKTFWFFSTTWNEMSNGGGSGFLLPYNGNSSTFGSPFSITNTSSVLGSSGIYGRGGSLGSGFIAPYSMGIWGDNSTGVGVAGTSNSIGVLGMTNGNDVNGIGVKGVNSSNNYAAITGENSSSGGGVRGIFTGPLNSLGYGVIGETGMNGNIGVAGKFISNNPIDPTNTLWALNYGKGSGLAVTMSNNQSSASAIEVNHTGTGKLLSLSGQNNADFSVSNNGNTTTTGTVTVKGNKGIIRNSSSTQLRYEVVQAAVEGLGGALILIPSGAFIDRSFNFSTPFPAPPAVSMGNLLPGYINAAWDVDAKIISASTTGFTIRIYNHQSYDLPTKGTWNVEVIGAE
jgi:hypothetical protein